MTVGLLRHILTRPGNLFSWMGPGPRGAQLKAVLEVGFILVLGVLFTVVLIQCCMKQIQLIWLQGNGRI